MAQETWWPAEFTEADKRPSAMAVGGVGLFLVILFLGTIVLLDASNLVRDCRLGMGNVHGGRRAMKERTKKHGKQARRRRLGWEL